MKSSFDALKPCKDNGVIDPRDKNPYAASRGNKLPGAKLFFAGPMQFQLSVNHISNVE